MAGLVVENYTALMRTFAQAPGDYKKEYRGELRTIAEPPRVTIERLALTTISGVRRSPQWAGMRTGITTKLVYIVPRQKGTHGRGPRRRPNFAQLLDTRAMTPGLLANANRIESEFENLLDRLVTKWDSGP